MADISLTKNYLTGTDTNPGGINGPVPGPPDTGSAPAPAPTPSMDATAGFKPEPQSTDYARQRLGTLLGSNAQNPATWAAIANQVNSEYGLHTGNEVYYDPSRNIFVTPWSGYFANGPGGWQWAQTHPEGPTTQAPQQLNYDQQLQYVQSRLGRSLTPQEMTAIRGQFGGTENDTTTTSILDQVLNFLHQGGRNEANPLNPGQGSYGNWQTGPNTWMNAPDFFGGNAGNTNGLLPGQMGYQGTNVFNDPATGPFEDLLNQRIRSLLQGYLPPDTANTLGYLRNYMQQLQGPAFTPAQMDLQQTQAIDPLTRNRDQQRQQAIQWAAAHGMDPNSGPAQALLQKINQGYETNATQARAGFANKAIDVQRQNQQYAAGLGPQIMGLEQNLFNNQENRSNQAVNLAQIIPTLAWQRLQGANGQIQQTNPASLLQLLQSFQQQGYNQGGDFSSSLMQILPYLLQLFGQGQPSGTL